MMPLNPYYLSKQLLLQYLIEPPFFFSISPCTFFICTGWHNRSIRNPSLANDNDDDAIYALSHRSFSKPRFSACSVDLTTS